MDLKNNFPEVPNNNARFNIGQFHFPLNILYTVFYIIQFFSLFGFLWF